MASLLELLEERPGDAETVAVYCGGAGGVAGGFAGGREGPRRRPSRLRA